MELFLSTAEGFSPCWTKGLGYVVTVVSSEVHLLSLRLKVNGTNLRCVVLIVLKNTLWNVIHIDTDRISVIFLNRCIVERVFLAPYPIKGTEGVKSQILDTFHFKLLFTSLQISQFTYLVDTLCMRDTEWRILPEILKTRRSN